MTYDLKKIRKKMQEKNSKVRDPNEFRPQASPDGKAVAYRFIILPPLNKGDKVIDGQASRGMDDLWYYHNGTHWFNQRPYTCPRIYSDSECPACSIGFEKMNASSDDDERRAIAGMWMPRKGWAMNIYFYPHDNSPNPKEYTGKVMWYNPSMQVQTITEACINRDNSGDPQDPQAFGVFYDENAAYPFQLIVTKSGKYPEYKTSRFLAKKRPICFTVKNNIYVPNKEEIQKVLDQRHDLFVKFSAPDIDKLTQIVDAIKKMEVEGAGFDDDEAQTRVTSKPAAKPSPSKPAAKQVPKPKAEEPAAPAPDETAGEVPVSEEDTPSQSGNAESSEDPNLDELLNALNEDNK